MDIMSINTWTLITLGHGEPLRKPIVAVLKTDNCRIEDL